MTYLLRAAGLAAVLSVAIAAGAGVAKASTVKVALFDVTAIEHGMMGQGGGIGMMGRGGFGGPGMMLFGGRGSGPGMMGAGMMSVRVDRSSVTAGSITFEVVNWSQSLIHEMVVVAVDSPDAPLPYDFDSQVVVESQIKVIGESEELEPSQSQTLELTLAAGDYLLICNIPGHYGAGMQTAFTVTE
jgi:uncharacterized cupredoxin-like copper-binding protein